MNTQAMMQSIIDQMSLGEQIQLRDMVNEAIDGPDVSGEEEGGGQKYYSKLDQMIIEHGRAGNRLMAVKECKETTGLGLKEAKDYCDALWLKNGIRYS